VTVEKEFHHAFFSLNPIEYVFERMNEGTQLRTEDSCTSLHLIFIGFMLLSILTRHSSIHTPQFSGFVCLK
jgi:hypothetical protein